MGRTLFHNYGNSEPKLHGSILVLPAVSMGNVGQMACDLLLNQAYHAENFEVKKVGYLHSKHVSPIAGNAALDGEEPSDLCTSITLYQFPSKNVTLMQQRGQVIAGHVQLYVSELLDWIQEAGFSKVVMLGGADASVRIDAQIVDRKPRFVSTSSFDVQSLEQLGATFAKPLEEIPVNPRTGQNMPFMSNLVNTGLLRKFYAESEKRGVSLAAIFHFCKEGVNVPEAVIMAVCANDFLQVFEMAEPLTMKNWKIPRSWAILFGSVPDTNLYM